MFTSDNKDDKLLTARALDVVNQSLERRKPCFLGFLNEREAYIINAQMSRLGYDVQFFGGYDGALRTVMCFGEGEISQDSFPIEPVYFIFRDNVLLSHRDFLGALMSLGVGRSCIGDIIVNNGCAVCYLKSEISEYVSSQITKVGAASVKISDKKPDKLVIAASFEDGLITVPSTRIDAVVAALTGLSRTKAAEAILSGKVFYNYTQTQNVSMRINDGILSVRGYGKFIIEKQLGVTKKGRLKLLIKYYR